nr:hypothetical protein Iba_scaffold7103CG0130 [Ipomoea batatas]
MFAISFRSPKLLKVCQLYSIWILWIHTLPICCFAMQSLFKVQKMSLVSARSVKSSD